MSKTVSRIAPGLSIARHLVVPKDPCDSRIKGKNAQLMPQIKKTSTKHNSNWTHAFGLGVVIVGLVMALASYHPDDPSLNTYSSTWRHPHNILGYLGSWSADLFLQIFGASAWLWPGLFTVALIRWVSKKEKEESILGSRAWIALGLLLMAATLFADLLGRGGKQQSYPVQGLLGLALSAACQPLFGTIGSYLVVSFLLWSFCMVWWVDLPGHVVSWTAILAQGIFVRSKGFLPYAEKLRERLRMNAMVKKKMAPDTKSARTEQLPISIVVPVTAAEKKEAIEESTVSSPVIRVTEKTDAPLPKGKITAAVRPAGPRHWDLPPLSLLEMPKRKAKTMTEEQLIQTAKKITSALKSFEVEGEVVEVSPGPIITMYEFQPAPGVRVQKIISASTDLAMNLGVPSVRIVAPIPGKSVAGIEVPNPDKEDILLRDVYETTNERAKTLKLPLVLGKDGEGRPIVEDLSRMPHLLVGGATSMGKSVLVNSILTGLLCRFNPEELKLIIVDPKLVEFKAFEDIPHLLLPIVNDPSDASQALKWAVAETKRRYLLMQKYSAKNLESYNTKVNELVSKGGASTTEKLPEPFPYIVIIIDELAELMLTAKKDVEQSIVRLTQLARAAGLHLIMATQRPSADVVTGLIKSNCPSRVSLRVASSSDSRIILDCTGAEQLLGRGDMFFTSTGPMGLKRMQSCFVSDGEIEKVCEFWRSQGEPDYREEILAPEISEAMAELNEGDVDDLYEDVLEFAREKGKISTSLIQRRFQIGYTRAARIMEQLESRGVVGEQSAAGKARDVIV